VDLFAVGTKVGSSADAPYLDLAYKLVSYQDRATLKLSHGKQTWVMPKQVWRRLGRDGRIAGDVLGLRGEKEIEGRPLLQPVMRHGRRLGPRGDWRQARERFRQELATLPKPCLRLRDPQPLVVEVSSALQQLQDQTRREALARQAAVA
jgi:nicotinate phosphoribosyltransferase